MAVRVAKIEGQLAELGERLRALPVGAGAVAKAVERWVADAQAVRFHLARAEHRPPMLVILGGTGTGKSTLVNRLIDANLTATSYRRTFTSGAVAIVHKDGALPPDWLGVPHVNPEELPARGQADALVVVPAEQELLARVTLVDTPDLDGDQPAHHAQADRAFRWAQAILFLVTPEKYQMTELRPYYRLAARYGVPSLFVMNKTDEAAVLEDYRQIVGDAAGPLFAIPRDDAAYDPPAEMNLPALRERVAAVPPAEAEQRERGLAHRLIDLLERFADRITTPLKHDRRQLDAVIASLRSLETPQSGVDVNPVTQQLQRRLQQRSVLYLMGPQRMLDRVRQVPGLLARLPRTMWDVVMRGQTPAGNLEPPPPTVESPEAIDFRSTLVDQMTVLQSRIDDIVRSSEIGQQRITETGESFVETRLDPADAGRIIDDELVILRDWLEKRWNANPRDTAVLQKLLKYIPGGERLTKWSEAAPYLLAIAVATHSAFFGHVDLVVLGGYSLATWLMERMSNEVAAQTRATNKRIADRFERLAHQQIEQTIEWLNRQAPSAEQIARLERLATETYGMVTADGR